MLLDSGAVECWGANRYSQADAPAGRFSAVSAGWSHSSRLRETGAVECWKDNGAADGRIEFAFTSAGGEHILPQSRYFPVGAVVGRWLRSTLIELGG